MKLDTVLERYVGQFGPYQRYVLLLIFTMSIPAAVHNIGYVFYAATPDHWCHFTRHYDVINMTEEQWKRFAIPLKDESKMEYEKCSMYSWATNPNLTAAEINATLTALLQGSQLADNQTVSCDNWEYDTWTHVRESLVTEWNMVCGRAWMKSNIATAYVIGFVIGAQLGGYLSDRFGRRPLMIGAATMAAGLGLILPFTNNYIAFLVVRCLLALTWHAHGLTMYPISLEAVGKKGRSVFTAAYMSMWAVSYMTVAGVAYGLRTWFIFMLTLAAPTVLFLLVPTCLIPESLQWLVAKGRQEEAEAALRKVAKWNKRSLPADLKLTMEQDSVKQRTSILDLVRTPNICRITVILCFNWFLNSVVYYNIAWNADALHGNLYLNVFFSGLLEIPAYILNVVVLQKLGRRWGTSLFTLASGAFFLISIYVPGIGGTVLILAAKFCITMTFTMLFLYTAELYPTVSRGTAMGKVNFVARLGMILASYIPLMGPLNSAIMCGAICVAGATTLLLLPETLNKPLPANVQEVERRGRLTIREIFSCVCSTGSRRNSSESAETKHPQQNQPFNQSGSSPKTEHQDY